MPAQHQRMSGGVLWFQDVVSAITREADEGEVRSALMKWKR